MHVAKAASLVTTEEPQSSPQIWTWYGCLGELLQIPTILLLPVGEIFTKIPRKEDRRLVIMIPCVML